MRQSRAFWAAFCLLAAAFALSLANPCVGAYALLYLALALAALAGYLVMRSRVRDLLDDRPADEEGRDRARRTVSSLSRTLLGFCSVLCVVAAVGTCLLTMLGLDAGQGAQATSPLPTAPLGRALDLWAAASVMAVAAAILLVTAGTDVRRWLRGT